MKKLIILLCFVLSLNSFVSCTCQHTFGSKVTREPTCSDGETTYYCTKCGYSYKERIPATEKHQYVEKIITEPTTTSYGKKMYQCSVCFDTYYETIEKLSWGLCYWKDDFGDTTKDAVAVTEISGTFSNSATTNSTLSVTIYVDMSSYKKIKMKFLEYGSYPVSIYGSHSGSLKIKTKSGTVESFSVSGNDGYLYVYNSDKLLNLILENKTLNCVMTVSGGSVPSTYKFEIKNLGLKSIYNKT